MSVFWTYWIESRLQRDSEILPEGFQSTRHETAKFLRLKEGSFRENGLSGKRRENEVVRTPRTVPGYTVTTTAKVAKKITERRLLQRLIEVNVVLTDVNVFVKRSKYSVVPVYMLSNRIFHLLGRFCYTYTCFLLSVMKFLLHCNHYKAYFGKPFINPFMGRLEKFFS